jgi:hypothetical protein
MSYRIQHAFHLVMLFGILVMVTAIPAAAHEPHASRALSDHSGAMSYYMTQEDVTVLDDPSSCITGVTPELFGSTLPSQVKGYSLVSARLTFAPGASIGAHIHPGTLVVTVVEGSLGFTLISDGQMDVNRAPAADGSRATDVAMPGHEVVLDAGDGFVETGMVHSARNASDGDTVVVISGLVEDGQPLTQCVAQ